MEKTKQNNKNTDRQGVEMFKTSILKLFKTFSKEFQCISRELSMENIPWNNFATCG